MPATFDLFFHAATSLRHAGEASAPQAGHVPYGYQCRLACGEPGRTACGEPPPGANGDPAHPDEATRPWLAGGAACVSQPQHGPIALGRSAHFDLGLFVPAD